MQTALLNNRIPFPEASFLRQLSAALREHFVNKNKEGANYTLLCMVMFAHLLLLFGLIMAKQSKVLHDKKLAIMTVSLVSNTSIESDKQKIQKIEKSERSELKPQEVQKKIESKPVITNLEATDRQKIENNKNQNIPEETSQNIEAAASHEVETKKPEQIMKVAEVETIIETEPPKFGAAYLNNPTPEYPQMARRKSQQGRVLLKVLVEESGIAETVELSKSSGFEKLDEAAITAVQKWTFIPAKRNNQAVKAYVLVPVKFSLSN